MEIKRTICVIGLGYIGLPTSALLAAHGYQVLGVDINPTTVNIINQGKIHIKEHDLDNLVHSMITSERLIASCTPNYADVFIIAVPTPFKDNHVPDLSYIDAAVDSIAEFLKPGNLVILESTSPVRTTEKIAERIQLKRPDLIVPHYQKSNHNAEADQLYIAYCPERVLPGHILRELIENDRIVGGIDHVSTLKAQEFYQTFVRGAVLATDARTAELSKLTENAYRDVNIAFANELSVITDKLELNVWELIRLANRHPRVDILQPGPGVGGHCIAVDPWFIVDSAPKESKLIRTAREVNDAKPHFVVEKIKQTCQKFAKPVIGCLGLAFKANIDDLRESPAVQIVEMLAALNIGPILVAEPNIDNLPSELANLSNVTLCPLSDVLGSANIVAVLVDHHEFKELSQTSFPSETLIIDTRGIFA